MKYLLTIILLLTIFTSNAQELVRTEKGAITIEYYKMGNGSWEIKFIKDSTIVFFNKFEDVLPLVNDDEIIVNCIERMKVDGYWDNKLRRHNKETIMLIIREYNKNKRNGEEAI